MKFALLPLLVAAPSLACLEAMGWVTSAGDLDFAQTIDNGVITCDSTRGWRIDQDGHISIVCNANYVYAFTRDGKTSWYGNPSQGFQLDLSPTVGSAYSFWDKYFFC
ncbi:hypothetical protein GQ53DRAFT_742975 [Thozetella sp. PMI_491]|nr:hypothetical protein GQ53DRAFT_742975 [Thozetella sp. PMI_491]